MLAFSYFEFQHALHRFAIVAVGTDIFIASGDNRTEDVFALLIEMLESS